LEQARELNAQVRDFVRKNADRLFERLEKEEGKIINFNYFKFYGISGTSFTLYQYKRKKHE